LAIQATGAFSKWWLMVLFLNKVRSQETKKQRFELNPELTQNSQRHFQFYAKLVSFRAIIILLGIYMGDIINWLAFYWDKSLCFRVTSGCVWVTWTGCVSHMKVLCVSRMNGLCVSHMDGLCVSHMNGLCVSHTNGHNKYQS
jgi:hypothetical protein